MDVGQPGQPRQLLVEARVVLHRAGAERVEAAVDRVILLREPREVADHLRLAETGQADRALSFEAAEAVAKRRRLEQVDAAAAGRILLKEERLLVLQAAVARHRLDRLAPAG